MAFGCCRNCAGSVAHAATTSEGHENPPVRGRFGGFPVLARFVKSAHAVHVGVSGTQLIWTRLRITMKISKLAFSAAVLFALPAFAQQGPRRFDWLPANNETVPLGAIMAAKQAKHQFKAPNDVHIQYFRWDCVQNCAQPVLQWVD